MVNYNSVQEIFDAQTANMSYIRNNVKNDDGTDLVTVPEWFTYKGNPITTIGVSGNSYIGVQSTGASNIQFNHRDCASYYVLIEEGTLYCYYKFFKVRWVGYSYYSSTSSACLMRYDVVFWDTGDISIYARTMCTSYNSGTYAVDGIPYTVSDSEPHVTFKRTDSGFELVNGMIEIPFPFDLKWLIKEKDILYTTKNGAIEVVPSEELNAQVFQEHGADEPPAMEDIVLLTDPQLLRWCSGDDYEGPLTVTMKATPFAQEIETPLINVGHQSILGISGVTETITGDVQLSVSIDDGETWQIWTGTSWEVTSEEGMLKEVVEAITTEQWKLLLDGVENMKLKVTLTDEAQSVTNIIFKYIN